MCLRPTLIAIAVISGVAPAATEPRSVQIGGAATISPKYEGSKDYEVRGFPIIAPAGVDGGGLVQFRGIDDIRFRVLQYSGFEAGPLAGYRFGRDEDDADRLQGLGDVDGDFIIGAYAAYNLGGVKPFVSYHHGIGGDDTGGLFRFGAEAKLPLAGTLGLTAIAGASYATSDYNDAYFSISAAQSAASFAGLGVYEADAGIKDVYFSLGADIPLTELWSLKLAGRYSHLLGDAADSPIVETEHQFMGLIGASYKFDLAR